MLMHTVSLDISHDMLRIGQQRLGPGARLTAGEFESLPFAAGSFDGAVCVSALHHVPNIPRALREIQRVLKDDGTAVFSEPGRGHARSPQARSEMLELGVLERDVVAEELMDECLRAGFRQVSVRPYIFPLPAYSPENWQYLQACREPRAMPEGGTREGGLAALWRRLRRRPVTPGLDTALQPVLAGHEAILGWQSILSLRNAIEAHPVIVAGKNEHRPDSRRPGNLRAEIAVVAAPRHAAPGEAFRIQATVCNCGDTLWLSRPTSVGGFVALGAKLVDANNLLVIHDYGRAVLSRDLAPGESALVEIGLQAPPQAGTYRIKLDMVDEYIAWFEHLGSVPALVALDVAAPLQPESKGRDRGR